MSDEEDPGMEVISSGEYTEPSPEDVAREYTELIREYSCTHDAEPKPEWCVWANNGNGGAQVLFWIRPSAESEFVARKIARHLKSLGSDVGADMTEWNSELKGEAIYHDTTEGPLAA